MNDLLNNLFALTQRIAAPFLRLSMGLIVFWIGALKFADPGPVRGLLDASLPFLASNAFVYLLGTIEVTTAVLLLAGFGVRYLGFVLMGLFAGTLTILMIASKITFDGGFPYLTLLGQFLLKDLALFAASVSLVAMYSAGTVRSATPMTVPVPQTQ